MAAALPLAPYVPTASDPWDRRKAAHLLRRAGFGAPRAEVDAAVQAGPTAALARLMPSAPPGPSELDALLDGVKGTLLDLNDRAQLQAWWLFRMMRSREPVREKLTLFWHGHFATADDKLDNRGLMHRQNKTLRSHALGPFRELVGAVSKDPAMLVYLDGASNVKQHPNENFARELMELFTLGIGSYTEQDVREAARAFTGWNLSGTSEYLFNTEAHDGGVKTVLGKSGKLDGTDVLDAITAHPACAAFLARKLARFFLTDDPQPEQVEPIAATLRATSLNIGETVRTLLASRLFYSPEVYRARVKSPTEYVVGMLRELGVRANLRDAADVLSRMGQELFNPPNVKGWDGGRTWINTNTMKERLNLAAQVCYAKPDGVGHGYRVEALVPNRSLTDVEGCARELLRAFSLDDLRPEAQAAILEFARKPVQLPNDEVNDEEARDLRIRGMVHLLVTSPEYQLC